MYLTLTDLIHTSSRSSPQTGLLQVREMGQKVDRRGMEYRPYHLQQRVCAELYGRAESARE